MENPMEQIEEMRLASIYLREFGNNVIDMSDKLDAYVDYVVSPWNHIFKDAEVVEAELKKLAYDFKMSTILCINKGNAVSKYMEMFSGKDEEGEEIDE